MSLRVEVALGDVLDRMTILARKAARMDGDGGAHVAAELAALRAAWADARLPDPDAVPEYAALAEVNAALWDAEDRLRSRDARGDFGPGFVADARAVYRLNDRRAALKRAASERLGSRIVEQKLHPRYAPE
ncbi:MAG: hypothetical protein RLZZ299_2617 [Pseudomonadota bacterium]|jgi:hypothetical protein